MDQPIMKIKSIIVLLCLLLQFTVIYAHALSITNIQQRPDDRKRSPGATSYYIDPLNGNDNNSGKNKQRPWKSFANANRILFTAGDRLVVLNPGRFENSLMISAIGTAKYPVHIVFAPGRYDLYDTDAYRTELNISNTNDVPHGKKAIAIFISNSKYVTINATGARMVFHAKMIETFIDKSEHITLSGISYDYNTPTVSEFKVTALHDNSADLQINKDTHYSIKDSLLSWEGDGWHYKLSWYWQEFDPATAYLTRANLSFEKARFAEIADKRLRVHFPSNPGFKQGYIYQTRDVTRDCAGIFLQHSKNIELKKVRIYFMHGMGIVSQFCQNIIMDSVVVKPGKASERTCAAWADILHFSNCKGLIEIKNSYLSAANDDAINIHGVHLKIVGQPAQNQLKMRFMHGQTYGFNAYVAGDSIELVHGNSLIPFAKNIVSAAVMLNEKEILLTLKHPVTDVLQNDDAVENITWTPSVKIHHNTIISIPTRGILITTRRKAVIENNDILRTSSPGIQVEDDAESWYESGPIRDLTIRHNNFFECGEPVISIHPENAVNKGPVHQNIKIIGNSFTLNGSKVLSAKGVANIQFTGNKINLLTKGDTTSLTDIKDCTGISLGKNTISNIKRPTLPR